MSLQTQSRRQFKKEIHFPFNTVQDAQKELIQLNVKLSQLRERAKELVEEFKALYPRTRWASVLPFYLVKYPDKSQQLLRWRASAQIKEWKGKRLTLTGPIIDEAISEAGLSENDIKNILYFDSRRIEINYVIAQTKYQAENLEHYLSSLNNHKTLKDYSYKSKIV